MHSKRSLCAISRKSSGEIVGSLSCCMSFVLLHSRLDFDSPRLPACELQRANLIGECPGTDHHIQQSAGFHDDHAAVCQHANQSMIGMKDVRLDDHHASRIMNWGETCGSPPAFRYVTRRCSPSPLGAGAG